MRRNGDEEAYDEFRSESQQMTGDNFDLERFVTAQARVFDAVLAELRAGRKQTHWMWFIFPQLRGLGRSPTAQLYGIGSVAEARAFHAHALLGPRLDVCTRTVLESPARSLHDIFGSPDDWKFRSCMTLFEVAVPDVPLFGWALDRWCAGERDHRTLQLLSTVRPEAS
jgi:uncharacterized protein (DUF1810 family)